jgi:hypothetical protein
MMSSTITRRPRRRLTISLAADEWDRLVVLADAEERDPYQQARWLIVRQLGATPGSDEPTPATADVA